MTSTTSQSDTIRLRSRISARSASVADTDEVEGRVAVIDRAADRSVAARIPLAPDLGLEVVRPSRRQRVVVRAFDLAVALVGLVVLAPLMVLVAVAVMLDSPGPVLYGSSRVGYRKPTFRAWKFRSMRPEAERDLDALLANDDAARREYECYHKLRDDPRLTRVGAVIRQTSLDELPQLFNILVGEMSVVGPRPKLSQDAEAYGDVLDAVLTVKPGLTGLWQVSGRNRLPMAERVALDVEYVTNRSLVGDLRICGRTFLQLWRPGKHGAY
jgi:lipopolysaccharide/colanic/teichoic acid biosynthesis glycosyltransferase